MLILTILNAILSWLCLFYLLCDYGEDVTSAFSVLSQSFYDVSWPLCPNEFQKLLVMMIKASQEPVYLKGYLSGVSNCSRGTFKQVNLIPFAFEMKIFAMKLFRKAKINRKIFVLSRLSTLAVRIS